MDTVITVRVNKKTPGTLSRVISSLKHHGLNFRTHHMDDEEDGNARLTVISSGAGVEPQMLIESMRDVKGVIEVIEVRGPGGHHS